MSAEPDNSAQRRGEKQIASMYLERPVRQPAVRVGGEDDEAEQPRVNVQLQPSRRPAQRNKGELLAEVVGGEEQNQAQEYPAWRNASGAKAKYRARNEQQDGSPRESPDASRGGGVGRRKSDDASCGAATASVPRRPKSLPGMRRILAGRLCGYRFSHLARDSVSLHVHSDQRVVRAGPDARRPGQLIDAQVALRRLENRRCFLSTMNSPRVVADFDHADGVVRQLLAQVLQPMQVRG